MAISIDTLPYECPFYGTCAKFKSLALSHTRTNSIKGDRKAVISFGLPRLLGNRYYDPKQDEEYTGIDFYYNGSDGSTAECRITVESQPARPGFPPSRLRVEMRSGDWTLLADVVAPFIAQLYAGGFLGEEEPASAPVAAAQPTAGPGAVGAGEEEPAQPGVVRGKRGPKRKSDEEIYDIARKYLQVKDRVTQPTFAQQYHISASTLKDYVKRYLEAVSAKKISG